MNKHLRVTWLLALLSVACGSSNSDDTDTGDASAAEADDGGALPTTFAEQVTLGGETFGRVCATCHGNAGQGTKDAPPLVGLDKGALPLEPRQGAKRQSEFVTVADVATFAVANMPPTAPGSLSAEEYWAILAFDLSANGITLEQKLTPEVAKTLTIPR